MRMLLSAGGEAQASEDGSVTAYWDRLFARDGELSIPIELEKRLTFIRAENTRWAYDAGASRRGGRSLAERLECGQSPSMWWTSTLYERHPKISPELYPVYKLRCLETLLEENGVTSLRALGADRTLTKALKALCAAKGIAFSRGPGGGKARGEGKGWKRRIYELFPAPVRAMLRFARWLWSVRLRLPEASGAPEAFKRSEEGVEKALIVTYFPNIDLLAAAKGRFRSRYWENLHGLLNAAAEKENPGGPHFVNWLFIRFPSPDLSLAQCLDLCGKFTKEGKDGSSFYYLEQFLTPQGVLKSLWRWLRLCLASLAAQGAFASQCHFEGSSVNFWPYAKKQWAESMRGWRCLERCLQNTAFKEYIKKFKKGRWVLYPLENCPWERMLAQAAREGAPGLPVYGAQHSIIRPTDFRYFDDPRTFSDPSTSVFQPDVLGANGLSGLSQWLDNGLPPERGRELEALRYQYLINSGPKEGGADLAELPPQPGEPLELPGERLLVLTSFFRDETDAHLALLKEALEAGLMDKWRVALKPHPYLSVKAWLDSLPPKLAQKVEIIETPLSLALAEGGFVWTSNSTTAALEAALKGLPLMVMGASGDFDLCPIQNVPNLARTSSLEDVRKYLLERPVPDLPANYLDLSPGLLKWRKLLALP